jgi:hypothetical protein
VPLSGMSPHTPVHNSRLFFLSSSIERRNICMVEPGPAFGRLVTSLGSSRMIRLCVCVRNDDCGAAANDDDDDDFPSANEQDVWLSNAAAAVFIDRDEYAVLPHINEYKQFSTHARSKLSHVSEATPPVTVFCVSSSHEENDKDGIRSDDDQKTQRNYYII